MVESGSRVGADAQPSSYASRTGRLDALGRFHDHNVESS